MDKLINVIDYDEYVSNVLNEDIIHGEQDICDKAFAHGGPITFPDGTVVKPRDIVQAVRDAFALLKTNYTRNFQFAERTMNIIFLRQSSKIKTMAVDKHMNLYMNAGFIYFGLKMDPTLIAAVIMHEVFHVMFKHIERGMNWLAAKGKTRTASTWHDTNLAADVEVNQSLVRTGIITEDRLINEIKGMYLKNVGGFFGKTTNAVPMEIILDNEDYMKKLREMCPPPMDSQNEGQEQPKIKTTEEWNQGYKDAWNKVASIIKKYGAKKAYDKFVEAGIVNEVGEIILKERTVDNIMAIEFLQVKSLEEYVQELNETNVQEVGNGQTYEEGFYKGFEKLMGKLYSSIQPQDDDDEGGEGGGGGGQQYDTDLDPEDLDEVDLPGSGQSGEGESDGLPENINNEGGEGEGDDKDQEGREGQDGQDGQDGDEDGKEGKDTKHQKSNKGGKGGKGKSDDQLTDADINKLADDIKKRTQGGTKKISTEQQIEMGGQGSSGSDSGEPGEGGIGGTGSFQSEGLSDDELREAGYSNADLAAINKVRKQNETNNSPERLEQEIDRARRNLDPTDFVRKYLDAIEIESNKYKNLWKQILEDFMSQKTRRAGVDKADGRNDWVNKKAISRGQFGIHRRKTAQDPQDVNIYVDVSGSMDLELLEIIAQSLVVFSQQWKYSGINICPWASSSGGVTVINDFYKKKKEEVTKEILEAISKGSAQCGGGTEGKALLAAMLDCVEKTLGDPEKKKKDDVHVVITDGGFDYEGIESRMENALRKTFDREDVADKAPENTIWMIYDASDYLKANIEKEIKKGKVIFIISEVVKNNK